MEASNKVCKSTRRWFVGVGTELRCWNNFATAINTAGISQPIDSNFVCRKIWSLQKEMMVPKVNPKLKISESLELSTLKTNLNIWYPEVTWIITTKMVLMARLVGTPNRTKKLNPRAEVEKPKVYLFSWIIKVLTPSSYILGAITRKSSRINNRTDLSLGESINEISFGRRGFGG